MRKLRRAGGFSLIELVIAVSLASFVLVAIASLAAQMTRRQVEGIRSGTVTGWSIISYMAMAKEIEDANVLAYPIVDNTAQDSIIVCKNWSRSAGAGSPGDRLDPSSVVTVVQYCVDPTPPVPPETGFKLRRYAKIGVPLTVVCPDPPAVPVPCTAAGPGWTENGTVGFNVEKLGGQNVFLRADAIGGVRVRYVVGQSTPTAQQPVAKYTPFDFGIAMAKQYTSTND